MTDRMDALNSRHMKTPIEKIIEVLFEIQSGVERNYEPEINAIWEEALNTYDRETLRHEFMPVIQQIWRVAFEMKKDES